MTPDAHQPAGTAAVTEDPRRTVLIGLDGEMSGTALSEGHRLIQAGLALRSGGTVTIFSSLVGWDDDQLVWDERAYDVHRIERERVLDAPRPDEVDAQADAFITATVGELGNRTLISVGFNVAAFDHPFFRATLPKTMRRVSRRAIDLNSLCFALDGWGGDRQVPRSWERWKKDASAWADEQLAADGQAGAPHDAGWDAGRALYALEFLRTQIHRRTGRPGLAEPH
jgi:hypothetical protein